MRLIFDGVEKNRFIASQHIFGVGVYTPQGGAKKSALQGCYLLTRHTIMYSLVRR